MKTNRLLGVVLIISALVSCQSKIDNITLTDFTKELISIYTSDTKDADPREIHDEIVIHFDKLYDRYSLSLFSYKSKPYGYCSEYFIGQTRYAGYLVRVFGEAHSSFFSVDRKLEKQKKCKEHVMFFDPLIWFLYFHKDLTFDNLRSHKDIKDDYLPLEVQNLAKKHFGTSSIPMVDNKAFSSWRVDTPPQFIFGKDSLQQIIESTLLIKSDDIDFEVPIIINIFVDKKGSAFLDSFARSSNNREVDNEALRVAEIICKHGFIPASHKGEMVNSIYKLRFFTKGETLEL